MANSYTNENELYMLYSMENGALTTDDSGKSHTLSNSNVTSNTTIYKEKSGSGEFNGSNAVMSVSTLDSGHPFYGATDNCVPHAVVGMFYLDTAPSTAGNEMQICGSYKSLDSDRKLDIFIEDSNDYLSVNYYETGSNLTTASISHTCVTGRWYFFCINTFANNAADGPNLGIHMYLYDYTGTTGYTSVSHSIEGDFGVADPIKGTAESGFGIGARFDTLDYRRFDGKIDGIHVFNRLLTKEEIEDLRDEVYAGDDTDYPRPVTSAHDYSLLSQTGTLTVNMPNGVEEDDLLLAFAWADEQDIVIDTPTGFTLELTERHDAAKTGGKLYVFYKVAGASEGSTIDFVRNDSEGNQLTMASVYRVVNADTSDPIDGSVGAHATSNAPNCPAVTASVGNVGVFRAFFNDDNDYTGTTGGPSSDFEVHLCHINTTVGGDGGHGVTWNGQESSGTTGAASFALANSEQYVSATVVVKPAGATTYTKTATIDAMLQEAGVTSSVTIDALLQEQDITASTTLDALLVSLRTSSITIDAFLQALKTTSTAIDAFLQDEYTLLTTIDAMLQDGYTVSTAIDALLVSTGTEAATIDALLQDGKISSTTIDAFLQDGYTTSATIDAILVEAVSGSPWYYYASQEAGSGGLLQ